MNAVKGKQGFQRRTRSEPTTVTLELQNLGIELDEAQRERMGSFVATFGKNKNYGTTDDLEAFGIYYTLPERLKVGEFALTDDRVDMNPDDPVFTRQRMISKSRVLEYVEMMNSGDDIAAVQVTDIPPGGGLWHLNGLHRLVASRILSRSINAEIWR